MSKKEYPIRVCKVCKKEFKPNIYNQIYCCKECYNLANKDKYKRDIKYKVCPICGTEFALTCHNKIFCSKECKKIANKKDKLLKVAQYNTCPICGKKFELTVYNKIYCSIECRKTSERKLVINKICAFCGKDFVPHANGQKYCCKRCSMDATNLRERKGINPKKCKRCNKSFQPIYPNEKYCDNCKKVAQKENKKIKSRNYEKYKRNNDINHKIKCWCRGQIYRCLHSKKSEHTFKILNYNIEQLKQRLSMQFYGDMSWSNHGTYWEIHHKKELYKFNFVLPNGEIDYHQVYLANNLCNLQPLTIEDHKKITSKYNSYK